MLRLSRRITGGAALGLYLWMGALTWFSVIPGAAGHWPPDFHALGYDVEKVEPFVTALTEEAAASYAYLLRVLDPAFIVLLATWITLMGWRAPIVRGIVALLAATYAVLDLAEDRAIHQFTFVTVLQPEIVATASAFTKAKFASLFSALMAMIWAVRREVA